VLGESQFSFSLLKSLTLEEQSGARDMCIGLFATRRRIRTHR
jgi:hypothetical protein